MPSSNPYQNALDIQNACNLSGVLFSFAKDMHTICDTEQHIGTAAKNTHPVVLMYLWKLCQLAQIPCDTEHMAALSHAQSMCERNAKTWQRSTKHEAVAKASEGEIVFECPEETCHHVETVTAAWMAEHGNPVCPDCDSDMVYEP